MHTTYVCVSGNCERVEGSTTAYYTLRPPAKFGSIDTDEQRNCDARNAKREKKKPVYCNFLVPNLLYDRVTYSSTTVQQYTYSTAAFFRNTVYTGERYTAQEPYFVISARRAVLYPSLYRCYSILSRGTTAVDSNHSSDRATDRVGDGGRSTKGRRDRPSETPQGTRPRDYTK